MDEDAVAAAGEAEEPEVLDIKMMLSEFLRTYRDRSGNLKYIERIKEMISLSSKSLVVDWTDLYLFDTRLAEELRRNPEEFLEEASEAVRSVVRTIDYEYAEAADKFFLRIRGLGEAKKLRELRSDLVGRLIMVEGILVRATPVKQMLVRAKLRHRGPEGEHEFYWPPEGEMREEFELPAACPVCGRGGSFKLVADESTYVDWQKVVIQEKPEEVPPGQLPRSIEVVLVRDLVDQARPGDRVTVTGILKIKASSSALRKAKPPVFDLYIDANYVEVSQKVLEEVAITKEDEERIKELARDPWIRQRIIASIAPAIYGHWDIKEAIALALFGGVPKQLRDGTRVRGDIHVLLIGDPGTAKSLTYSEHILVMDGRGLLDSKPIGEVVDEYMERFKDHVATHGETEELRLDAVGVELYTVAISPITFKPEVKRIKALIRHRAPRRVVVVRTRFGRRAVITKEHSLIGFDKATSTLVAVRPFDALKDKMLVPVLRDLAPLRRRTVRYIEIGGRRVELDWDLGYLLGFFLGDGTVTRVSSGERIEMITTDPRVAEHLSRIVRRRLGARCRIYRRRGISLEQYRLIITEKKLVEWIKTNCFTKVSRRTGVKGELARHKKVPRVAFNAPLGFVEGMISGLIDSDGTVIPPKSKHGKRWRGEIVFSTTSSSLAYGVSVLLAILGLQYTIRYSYASYRGERTPYFKIYVSDPGAGQVIRLMKASKRGRIALLAANSYSMVDRVPLGESLLRALSLLGFNSRRNGDRVFSGGVPGKIYRGHAGRKYAGGILGGLSRAFLGREPEDLQKDAIREIRGDPRGLVANTLVTWDTLRSVEEVDIEEVEPEHNRYVYDVSVEDHENFVGGLGNIFLHNSQLLQFVSKIAPRGIYTSGKGSSAAGLTAAVLKDKSTGEYYLEAGALVLADGGIACLHPSTRVLVDGRYVGVERLFDEERAFKAVSRGEPVEIAELSSRVVGIDPGLRAAVEARATLLRRKMWRGRLVKLRLESGAELLLTPDHWLIDGETGAWREAGSFRPGDTVLNLRRLPGHNDYRGFLESLLARWRGAGLARTAGGGGTQALPAGREALEQLAEAEWGLRVAEALRIGSWDPLPSAIDAIAYIMGLAAERSIVDVPRGAARIAVPGRLDVAVAMHRWLSRLFGSVVVAGAGRREVAVYSRFLAWVLEEMLSNGLEGILELPDGALAAFIAGVVDASARLEDGALVLRGLSIEALETLQLALRRLGVYSRLDRDTGLLVVEGGDLGRLADAAGPYSWLLKVAADRIVRGAEDRDGADGDVYRDRVVSVDWVEYEGPVYDLYVPGIHSFVAGAAVVHNCIDEFDKMREEDRSAIHEALEQQSISIAKAGIVARLNARTTVIAAGNPKYGRFVGTNIAENVNLPPTILSRFDLIFVMKDIPRRSLDSKLARHIMHVHREADQIRPEIPPELLKKYISYARRNVRPRLTREAARLIEEFFITMRKEDQPRGEGEERHPIPITARQLEALVRLAEAHARMALKERVEEEDALEAIRLMHAFLESVGKEAETGSLDADILTTGISARARNKMLRLKEILRELASRSEASKAGCVPLKEIEVAAAAQLQISKDEIYRLLRKMVEVGDIYEKRFNCYKLVD